MNRPTQSLPHRPARVESELNTWHTCCSSFSISPARATIGPRTAYSIALMCGFSVSIVKILLDDDDEPLTAGEVMMDLEFGRKSDGEN